MRTIIVMMFAILFLAHFASADIIIKYKSEAIVAKSRVYKTKGSYNISGDKNYSEKTTNFSMLTEPGKPYNIISKCIFRLDKGICWNFFSVNKYSESTIKSLHDSMEQVTNYVWTYNIIPKPGKKKINKFQCLGQIGKAIGISKDDPADTVLIAFEQWSTEDTSIGSELTSYQNYYSQLAGVHKIWAQDYYATFLESSYGVQFENLSDLFNNQKGIPIKTNILIERSILYDDSNPNDIATQKGRGVRSKDDPYWKIALITIEVTSIENKKIDDSKFEIPANYEKK